MNQHLLEELTRLGVWNDEMKNQMIAENGSIQNIPGLSEEVKAIYKTAWEIPQVLMSRCLFFPLANPHPSES